MSKKSKGALTRREMLLGPLSRLRREEDEQEKKPARAKERDKDEPILGDAAMAAGDFQGAVTAYRQLLKEDPEDAEARTRLGCSLYRMGKLTQASCELSRVHKKTGDPMATLHLGLTQMRQGHLEKAAATLKGCPLEEHAPLMREINLFVAMIEEGMQPAPDAAEAIEKALGHTGYPGWA